MHCCTIRLCAWRIFRQLRVCRGQVRFVSTTSTTARNSRPTQNEGKKRLGRYNDQYQKASESTQDIFVDDLSATLEAHRARNRASVIRKLEQYADDSILPYKRLVIQHKTSEDAETACETGRRDNDQEDPASPSALEPSVSRKSVNSKKQKKRLRPRLWPADSVQGIEEDKAKRNGFTRSVDPLEYQGEMPRIQELWRWPPVTRFLVDRNAPWLLYMEKRDGDHYERLSDEIRAFEAYMSLSPAEEAAAQFVKTDIVSIVQSLVPTDPLTLLGSRSTGLATPTSDFDFSVDMSLAGEASTKTGQGSSKKALKNATLSVLGKIRNGLRRSKDVVDTDLVIARVPIVSCRHRATGLDVQFQTRSPFQASQQYTAAYLSELPSLRPLYILIRHFLVIRNLTTVFLGGVGSYTILMMIVAALKHSSGKFAPDDLGGQLLHVLDFYSSANLYEIGFSVEPPRTFKKHRDSKLTPEERKALSEDLQLQGIEYLVQNSNPRKPYLLCLQDPANTYNDLGRNTYAIKHVQAAFLKVHESLTKRLAGPELKENRDILAPMVRADYTLFELDRRNIERCDKPDAKLSRQDANDDTIASLLERRVKIYKGGMEEDELPFTSKDDGGLEPIFGRTYWGERLYSVEMAKRQVQRPTRTKTRGKEKKEKRTGAADTGIREGIEEADDMDWGNMLSRGGGMALEGT